MKHCEECKKGLDPESAYLIIEQKGVYLCSYECAAVYAEKEREKENFKALQDQIYHNFGVSFPTERMLAEIKRFREKEGMTLAQIRCTLHYIYDIKQIRSWNDSLYLVSQYKDSAEKYYREQAAMQQKVMNFEEKTVQAETIVAKETPMKEILKKRGNSLEISIEDI